MSAQFLEYTQFVVVVPTAGTPVQLVSTPLWVRSVSLQSHYQNTGTMLLGDSSTNALQANARAFAPGDSIDLSGTQERARSVQLDLSEIWVNSTVNGGKFIVSYMAEVLHQ